MLDTLTTIVEAGAAAPWVLLVVLLVAVFDALFPPLPSEGLVVALAAISVATQGPDLVLLAMAAGAGAFIGDTLTYLVGRRHGTERLDRVSRPSIRRMFDRASGTLHRRGAVVVLSARYVPMGRVAVNLTAGATGFPPRRFVGLAALAAGSWAVWSVAVGAAAGRWFEGNPLLGSLAGVLLAVALGVVVDRVARRVAGWRTDDAAAAGATTGGPATVQVRRG